jgi:hypothetical protein
MILECRDLPPADVGYCWFKPPFALIPGFPWVAPGDAAIPLESIPEILWIFCEPEEFYYTICDPPLCNGVEFLYSDLQSQLYYFLKSSLSS